MEDVEFILDDDTLAKLASASLIGMINNPGMKRLRLVFPRSTMAFLEKNGGPRELILLEYNVPCLIEDILWLKEKGVEVEVEFRVM